MTLTPSERMLARRRRHRRRRLTALAAIAVVIVAVTVVASGILGGVDTHGARVLRYTIAGKLVDQRLGQVAVQAPGSSAAGRPLLVFLHGKGEDQESNLVGGMFAALAELGPNAPDVVFPDGGEDSYWHDRADGAWARYVLDEVIPEAERRLHSDPRRVAIGGLSMGGFGAYDLALAHPHRFCAVGGDSAALWQSAGETAQGAFDDAEDFARNDVIGSVQSASDPFPGAQLWLDVGSADPFLAADSTLAHLLRAKGIALEFHVWPGGHDQGYWSAHWRDYLSFYAHALARC